VNEDEVRRIVREELAKLLTPAVLAASQRLITETIERRSRTRG
jgi:hypothetical protein